MSDEPCKFNVVYCAKTNKKRKTWSDGTMTITADRTALYSDTDRRYVDGINGKLRANTPYLQILKNPSLAAQPGFDIELPQHNVSVTEVISMPIGREEAIIAGAAKNTGGVAAVPPPAFYQQQQLIGASTTTNKKPPTRKQLHAPSPSNVNLHHNNFPQQHQQHQQAILDAFPLHGGASSFGVPHSQHNGHQVHQHQQQQQQQPPSVIPQGILPYGGAMKSTATVVPNSIGGGAPPPPSSSLLLPHQQQQQTSSTIPSSLENMNSATTPHRQLVCGGGGVSPGGTSSAAASASTASGGSAAFVTPTSQHPSRPSLLPSPATSTLNTLDFNNKAPTNRYFPGVNTSSLSPLGTTNCCTTTTTPVKQLESSSITWHVASERCEKPRTSTEAMTYLKQHCVHRL